MLIPVEALAVNPLTVDDADTVDFRHLQLNAFWQFSQTSSSRLHAVPINLTYGLTARGELGAAFGYLRRDAAGAVEETDVDGASDLALSTKWRLWQSQAGFKLSARLDVKLPVASAQSGLGTGTTDVGGVLLATRCWGRACLDWNLGYVAVGASRSDFGDDTWFLGQSVRYCINDRWTFLGEVYGLVPNGDRASSANVHFNGGPQFAVGEDLLLSALIGSATGRSSPDLTARLALTWVF